MARERVHVYESSEALEPKEYPVGRGTTVRIETGQIVVFPDTPFWVSNGQGVVFDENGDDLHVILNSGDVTLLGIVELLENPGQTEIRFGDGFVVARVEDILLGGSVPTAGDLIANSSTGGPFRDDGLGHDGSIAIEDLDPVHINAGPAAELVMPVPVPTDIPNSQPLPDVQTEGLPNPEPLPDVPEADGFDGGDDPLPFEAVLADGPSPAFAALVGEPPLDAVAGAADGAAIGSPQPNIVESLFDGAGLDVT